MKMTKIVRRLMESSTADQAKQMGLVYAGYGRWRDPQTGKIVARTQDGQLVKIDDDGASGASMGVPQTGPDAGGGMATNDVPSIPVMDKGLSKLMSQAGGDVVKLRKSLLKKAQGGNEKATAYLSQLDDYEAKEKAALDSRLGQMQKASDDAFASQKAKYAAKYPKVDI